MSVERIIEDLQASGLTLVDIDGRPLSHPERAATSISHSAEGYVIPYRDIQGTLTAFYRVKIFDYNPKYKQPKDTGNTVYFPKGFKALAESKGYVLITEGEKKAACACKNGFPAVGLGGVDSWKNRTVVLPENVKLDHHFKKENLVAKVPPGSEPEFEILETNLAVGLQDLIDFATSKKLTLIIVFDTDTQGLKFEVQRAAATLGYELRARGVPLDKIKQLVLPLSVKKVGLDDFIVQHGVEPLKALVEAVRKRDRCFPRHPNVVDFLNKKLQRNKLNRKECQQIALATLCELDTRGARLRSATDDQMYYFDSESKKLMQASLKKAATDVLIDSEFSRFLYQEFGISHSDIRLTNWLATLFTSEPPIGTVTPCRVVTVRGDNICYQLNDGQYIRVNAEGYGVCDNGTDGVLFESGKVQHLEGTEILAAIRQQPGKTIRTYWVDVLERVRLKKSERQLQLIALLYYLAPWINRWRGTQLPVEMIIGESGSGKSSLYELRLKILLGEAQLRNAPHDMKDWWAGITDAGGMHVIDNVQLTDKGLRQRLSDEMCRLVTESNPHIEMRKLYSNVDVMRVPIQTTFAMTAIQQPFHNVDLVQRSIIIELDKGQEAVEFDMNWVENQLSEFGGRVEWVAHHLHILHLFLRRAKEEWNTHYKAKHRLINMEQAFVLMAKTLGMEHSWIPDHLAKTTTAQVSESDWTFEGLCEYAKLVKKGINGKGVSDPFSSTDIAGWAQNQEDYCNCMQLVNARSLGRYLQAHKQMLAQVAGIRENGMRTNKMMYVVYASGGD